MNETHRNEVEILADEGFDCLYAGEFDRALEIAAELKELRYSAAFDIGAQAYVGLGDPERAIEILQEGLAMAPNAWANWQLLGNLFSDIGKFEEAKECYSTALTIEGVWESSINLNLGILYNRLDNFKQTLITIEDISEKELWLHKTEVEMIALLGLERFSQAKVLGKEVISISEYGDLEGEMLARISALLGDLYLKTGSHADEVRSFLIDSLDFDPASHHILSSIRNIDNEKRALATYFQTLLHFKFLDHHPEYTNHKGFLCNYHIVAGSEDHVIELASRLERQYPEICTISIEEIQIVDTAYPDLCGVYWRSERAFYQ